MKLRRILSCIMALLIVCGLPVSALAEEYDLAKGSITVTADESGQYVTQADNNILNEKQTSDTVITQSNSETATSNTVTITAEENATANVTLDGVNIDVGGTGKAAVEIKGNGDVVIELDGTNTVQSGEYHAGVEKNNSGNLTITDENGTNGSLTATGGYYGSGIGGGYWSHVSDITITGNAEVNATGGGAASGIGGGANGSGSNITITGSAEVNANGGDVGSGIGGGANGSGSNITISGSAEVTANGGLEGSGIGGGRNGSGSDITISGSAKVDATGSFGGSGIGGGDYGGTGSNITVSEDAQVKAQGGFSGYFEGPNVSYGAGAAIGDGGLYQEHSNDLDAVIGEEAEVTTEAPEDGKSYGLYVGELNEGWIAKYAPGAQINTDISINYVPGANMDTDIPNSVTYMDDSNTLQTATENITLVDAQPATCTEDGHEAGFQIGNELVAVTIPATGHSFTNYIYNKDATYTEDGTKTAKCDHPGCGVTDTIPDPGTKLPCYRVIGKDGKDIPHQDVWKDGVLTITADADYAILTGTLGGIQALKAQGIDTIVFVTNGASSTFALSDLLEQGSTGDSYELTHDGETASFTLGEKETDVTDILVKP